MLHKQVGFGIIETVICDKNRTVCVSQGIGTISVWNTHGKRKGENAMSSKIRIMGLLLAMLLLLAACANKTEQPTLPEETAAPEVQMQGRVYPFYYIASGGNSVMKSNAVADIASYADQKKPERMTDVFSAKKLGRKTVLNLQIPQLSLTRDMQELTLELECYRSSVDPRYAFRIWWSDDRGENWTELTGIGEPEPTGESFHGTYPIVTVTLQNFQNQIPEGVVVTDLKIEPYSGTQGAGVNFRLIRAAIHCRAPREAIEGTWSAEPVEGRLETNGTAGTILEGTVDGEKVTAEGYTAADTLELTGRLWVVKRQRNTQMSLKVLVPEGETPVVPNAYYSKVSKTWFGPVDVEALKTGKSFVTGDNQKYDIYEIVAHIPREADMVRRIKWEVTMNGKELYVLDAEVAFCTERDDAPMIQKMIDDAKAAGQTEIVIPKVNPATGKPGYNIGTTVWLSSDTTVILDGCYMRFMDDVMCNMFASRNAWSTPDDPELMAGYRNIRILGKNGATFDGGNSNGKTEKTVQNGERMLWNCFVLMRNVDGFEVSGIKAKNSRYWCFTFLYGRNGSIHDIEFDCHNEKPNQDGIDLRQGCHNIDIYNLTGITGDDTVALTAIGRNDAWHTVNGITDIDIHDVTIRNVRAGCSGGHGVIRLLAQDGKRVYNVTMSDLYDGALEGNGKACYGFIRIGDVRYFADTPQAYGDITGITIENVTSGATAAIYVNNENITSEHITWTNVVAEKGVLLKTQDDDRFYGRNG